MPEVAGAVVPGIEVLGIPAVNAAKQNRQRVLAGGEDDKMHVVGHEAPAEERCFGVKKISAEQAEVGHAVGIVGEGKPAVYPALGHVAGDARKDAAITAWHMWRDRRKGGKTLGIIAQIRLSDFRSAVYPALSHVAGDARKDAAIAAWHMWKDRRQGGKTLGIIAQIRLSDFRWGRLALFS